MTITIIASLKYPIQKPAALSTKTLLVLLLCLTAGCSMQQQRDKAEQEWLRAQTARASIDSVSLQNAVVPDSLSGDEAEVHSGSSFHNAAYARTTIAGHLQSDRIGELSGLAPVRGIDEAYWAINDSGNRSELFAVSSSGKELAAIKLPIANVDWEDLASFEVGGESWVMIADTGDNLQRRGVSSLYFFKQPDASKLPLSLSLHHRIDFNYEDGPKNVESVAVSVTTGQILLIAKASTNAGVYTLPLKLTAQGRTLTASKSGLLATLEPNADDKWWERTFAKGLLLAPTSLDISADDRLAVVGNYRHAYLFKRASGESWPEALTRKPQILLSHRMEQSESVAFSSSGNSIIVSSEGLNAPVVLVKPSPSGS